MKELTFEEWRIKKNISKVVGSYRLGRKLYSHKKIIEMYNKENKNIC